MSDVQAARQHGAANHAADLADRQQAETSIDQVSADTVHGAGEVMAQTDHHPNAARYVQIATILTILTLFEVAVYYLKPIHVYLVPVLIVLSTTKFVLVVLFYMHLKFDNKLFSALFTLGLI